MRVFDIIGPVMIGPSSSHTAGACRIGRAARKILNEEVGEARLELHGAFSIREGNTVNPALIAGLLGYNTDNERIHFSEDDAKAKGIVLTYVNTFFRNSHANTVRYTLKGDSITVQVKVASVGGGMIEVQEIDNAPVSITGDYHTLLTFSSDLTKTGPELERILQEVKFDYFQILDAVSDDMKTQIVLVKSKTVPGVDLLDRIEQLDSVKRVAQHTSFIQTDL